MVAAFFPNAGDKVSSYLFETMSIKVASSFSHQRGASVLPCCLPFFLFRSA